MHNYLEVEEFTKIQLEKNGVMFEVMILIIIIILIE